MTDSSANSDNQAANSKLDIPLSANPQKIIALVEGADHVCCRYRITAFKAIIERAGHQLELAAIPKGPLARWNLFRRLKRYDIVILQRKLFSRWELLLLRKYAKKLIFDYDDAVWSRDSFAKSSYDRKRERRFINICKVADVVTPGNKFLEQNSLHYATWVTLPVQWVVANPESVLIPTCVDENLYPRDPISKPDDKIRLVWIGSSSTLQGLKQICSVLDSLAEVSDRLVLRIICDQELELSKLPVEFVPWDAKSEVLRIAESDIGISWIPDDFWSRGKCGLKTLQYMAAGLPVIANPVGVHPEMIIEGENGFLVRDENAWLKAVRSLIEKPDLRRSMGLNSRRRFENRYSVLRGAALWLKLIDALSKPSENHSVRQKPRGQGNRIPTANEIQWQHSLASPLNSETLNLQLLVREGHAEIIKEGPHRTVFRVLIDRERYYWKFCKLSGPRAWAREWLRQPKARLEFDQARALWKMGIATFEPIAWGVELGFFAGQSHLITREIGETQSLMNLLESWTCIPPAPRDRRNLTKAFAGFVANLHNQGIMHPDPHPGNFLIRWEDRTQAPEFFLLDIHAVTRHSYGYLNTEVTKIHLALINRWFVLRTTRLDRMRFWREYFKLRRWWEKLTVRDVDAETRKQNFDFWASRYRRAISHKRHFPSLKSRSMKGFRAANCPSELADILMSDPDQPFAQLERLWKNSKSSSVVPLEFQRRQYVLKRFRIQSFGDALKNRFRRSPALHSWLMGHALLDRLLPTAIPVLVLHRMHRGIPREGYLLCELLPEAQELQEVLDVEFDQCRAYKRELIHQLARTIRHMHERGITHRDLKAANLLVQIRYPKPKVYFIDLVGMRIRRQISPHRAWRDLVRLNASFTESRNITRTDRLRFLRTYQLWPLRGREDWKACWKWVAEATQAKIARNQKRGRVLK